MIGIQRMRRISKSSKQERQWKISKNMSSKKYYLAKNLSDNVDVVSGFRHVTRELFECNRTVAVDVNHAKDGIGVFVNPFDIHFHLGRGRGPLY
jgi:hypothetical protein